MRQAGGATGPNAGRTLTIDQLRSLTGRTTAEIRGALQIDTGSVTGMSGQGALPLQPGKVACGINGLQCTQLRVIAGWTCATIQCCWQLPVN